MTILTTLENAGLISRTAQSIRSVVESHFGDLLTMPINPPSAFVDTMYLRYKNLPNGVQNNNLNGKVFELLIAIALYRSGIRPLYQQAIISYVPNVEFDFTAFCDDESIISISTKTSFRERWKQADLEALALKSVHRKAKCYLVSYEVPDAKGVQKKILNGGAMGLDQSMSAVTSDFDALVASFNKKTFIRPPIVPLMKSAQLSSI